MQDWRDLDSFPGWAVNSQGDILNEYTSRVMRVRQNAQGITMVGLTRRGERKQYTRSVALIVARAFVENPMPEFFDSVIHLNGDRIDCRALNLMWRSRSFALRYHDMFNHQPYRLAVYIPQKKERYASLREACTTYGLVEPMAYMNLNNREPCFPYNWYLERLEH